MEASVHLTGNDPIEFQLVSQPFVLYQETPYASIPVSDVEVTARAKVQIDEPEKVGDVTFFSY